MTSAVKGIFFLAVCAYALITAYFAFFDPHFSIVDGSLLLGGSVLILLLWWNNRILVRTHSRFLATSENLAASRRQLDTALNSMSQALGLFDAGNNLILSNRLFSRFFNLKDTHHQPGIPFDELERRVSGDPSMLAIVQRTRQRIVLGQLDYAYETRDDGRVFSITHRPTDEGGCVVTFHDITERRQTNARIDFLASHDRLTGLPNRAAFREKIADALADRAGHCEIAVLLIDLNGFKVVNESFGDFAGDNLLGIVAERIRTAVPANCMIARMGADVFGVLQTDMVQPRTIAELSKTIAQRIAPPVELDGTPVLMTASCGIAHAMPNAMDADTLLNMAELALDQAKVEGRDTARIFEPQMAASAQKRHQTEALIREAIAKDLFELHYQPLMNIRQGGVSACEALLRIRHLTLGLIPPMDFIPVAESMGAIGEIGALVLRQACREAATWPGDIKVSVNVSPLQFASRDVLCDVENALVASGLPATRLDIEITESALLIESEATLNVLHKLRARGISISMDDFGTGYSSFNYLRRFPFDRIKIDKSFVRDVASHEDAIVIVKAVTSVASSLGMSVTAEGIETVEQLERVRAGGCTEAQGYLFCRPVRAEELRGLLLDLASDTRAVA